MSGIKVTRETPSVPLPSVQESTGTVDDEDVDWSTGPNSPFPLDGLSNVDTTGKADGDTIIWDAASGKWIDSPGSGSVNAELNIEGGQSVIKAHGSMGSTETIDPTDGNVHTGTLDANVTYTLNAPAGSGAAEIEFQRTGSGGPWTETWPGSVTWLGGSAPTPPTTGNTGIVILRSLDGGTTWLGIPVGSGTVVAALDDLTDVTITTPASGEKLRYNGSVWVNANLHDEPMIASDGSVQTDGLLNPQMHEVAW